MGKPGWYRRQGTGMVRLWGRKIVCEHRNPTGCSCFTAGTPYAKRWLLLGGSAEGCRSSERLVTEDVSMKQLF